MLLNDIGDPRQCLQGGLPALVSLLLPYSLTSQRAQYQLPLLGARAGQVWDRAIAWLGEMASQTSIGSGGNVLPEPRAEHGCATSEIDAFTPCPSPAPLPTQGPGPRLRRQVSRDPGVGLSLQLSDSTSSPLIENIAPSDKEAATQMVFWLCRQRLLFLWQVFL